MSEARIDVRIGRLVVDRAATGGAPKDRWGERLGTEIAHRLSGRPVDGPVDGIADEIAARIAAVLPGSVLPGATRPEGDDG